MNLDEPIGRNQVQSNTPAKILSAGAILGHITPRERGAAAEEN